MSLSCNGDALASDTSYIVLFVRVLGVRKAMPSSIYNPININHLLAIAP